MVSFENKEIFETAIQLSKLGSTSDQRSLGSTLEAVDQNGNFMKVKPSKDSIEIRCNEDQLEFSLHEAEDGLDESNHYQHPMIGERQVLGQDLSKNTKCLSVSKSNRLENTLKKFGAQQNEQQDLYSTVKTPQSESKITSFNSL